MSWFGAFARRSSRIVSSGGARLGGARFGSAAALGSAAAGCAVACACDDSKPVELIREYSVDRGALIRCSGGEEALQQNYELQKQIGKGGFGTVTAAKHRFTGLVRAVKAVAADAVDQQYVLARLAEVTALMALDHPNVVKLFEYYGEPGDEHTFLVMEYCTGGTLEQRIEQRGGRLSPAEAAVAMRQMLRGVLCCHAHGIAHRDLKPDNFAYSVGDDLASLKVIDFGLSLGTDSNQPLSEQAKSYLQAAGTLQRSAPETLPTRDRSTGAMVRSAHYGKAADVWSLGAILFAMLTGEPLVDLDSLEGETAAFRRLFDGSMLPDDVARKLRSERFMQSRMRALRWRVGREAPAVCDLCEQMLQPDPERRITAAQALKHPCILDSYEATPEAAWSQAKPPADDDICILLSRIRHFADAPPLRRLAVLAAAHLLGPQDEPSVRAKYFAFRTVDTSGDGVLTASEIQQAVTAYGSKAEVPPDLDELLKRIDVGGDGEVNLVEFVAATMSPRVYTKPSVLRAAFGLLDADGDGWITAADLEVLLSSASESAERASRANALLASAGPDKHGRVSYARFEAIMREAKAEDYGATSSEREAARVR